MPKSTPELAKLGTSRTCAWPWPPPDGPAGEADNLGPQHQIPHVRVKSLQPKPLRLLGRGCGKKIRCTTSSSARSSHEIGWLLWPPTVSSAIATLPVPWLR